MFPESKWSISTTGTFLHNNKPIIQRPIFIIHLDDHKLFAKGLHDCIIPFFPLADILNIPNGARALGLMKEFINDKMRIDLIITDINHPGLKGDEFLMQLREVEKNLNAPRTPAIVLSFVDADRVPQISAPGLNIVDRYFSKCAEGEDIVDAMEDILYGRK